MKKLCFFFALCIPFFSCAEAILDLLQLIPSECSQDFVLNKQQFQLHSLMTEQRHPKTWDLSQKIQHDTLSGIEALLSVDVDISEKIIALSEDETLFKQAATSIKNAISNNQKVYIYGCGATGRLAKQMESSFWRPFWKRMKTLPLWEKIKDIFPYIEEQLIGEMTGGDRALISSLEGFEDLQLIGKLQLEDRHIQKGDVIFSITEGGETSSVIGTILAALNQYEPSDDITEKQQHLYFVYNNPNFLLLPFERSRSVIDNRAITKICLATGPQSITGSTRMQATTIETFVMGVILEQAIYELLLPYLTPHDLDELGLQASTMKERLLSFLLLQQTIYKARVPISQFTDLESMIYQKGAFTTYFAQNALITVFIDSTERAPTFRLFPLDTSETFPRKSWIQVWTPASDRLQAWNNFLGRPFYGLDKSFYERSFLEHIDDPYLKMAALKSLNDAGSEQQLLYDFSYSAKNIATHGPQRGDLGVIVLFADELEQLMQPASPFQHWLNTFAEAEANVAVILVSSASLTATEKAIETIYQLVPHALIVQLSLDCHQDPLRLRQHVGLKMMLNAHSTGVMAKLGRVVGNTMTSVNPGNLKLIGRATFLILSHVNDKLLEEDQISYAAANAILFDAIDYCKRSQKVGQNAEVGLCIIRILETLHSKSFISWEEAENILNNRGLERYLMLKP